MTSLRECGEARWFQPHSTLWIHSVDPQPHMNSSTRIDSKLLRTAQKLFQLSNEPDFEAIADIPKRQTTY